MKAEQLINFGSIALFVLQERLVNSRQLIALIALRE